jgi:hypothetical protein
MAKSIRTPRFKHATGIFKLLILVISQFLKFMAEREGFGLSSHLRFAAEPRTHSAVAFAPSIRTPRFKHATGIFKLLILVISQFLKFMAEREGFEPSRQFITTYTLSKRALSTAQPSLH